MDVRSKVLHQHHLYICLGRRPYLLQHKSMFNPESKKIWKPINGAEIVGWYQECYFKPGLFLFLVLRN